MKKIKILKYIYFTMLMMFTIGFGTSAILMVADLILAVDLDLLITMIASITISILFAITFGLCIGLYLNIKENVYKYLRSKNK